MTKLELLNYVKAMLGSNEVGGVLRVELTPLLEDEIVKAAFRWFTKKRGIVTEKNLQLYTDQSEYTLPSTVQGVADVFIEGAGVSSAYDFVLPDDGAFPAEDLLEVSAKLPYGTTAQNIIMQEMASRVLGYEFTWEFLKQTKLLRIMPSPSKSMIAIYLAIERLSDVEDLVDDDDIDLVSRYALATAKIIVGRQRSKFTEYPAAGGSKLLDGDRLVTEGKEEILELNEDIEGGNMPIGFVVG